MYNYYQINVAKIIVNIDCVYKLYIILIIRFNLKYFRIINGINIIHKNK